MVWGGYRYGFNGKELDNQGEWGSSTIYDFGARVYDPAIGKFLSVDPLSSKRSWMTPYNFVQNSPLSRVDPTGALDSIIHLNFMTGEAKTIGDDGGTEHNTYLLTNGLPLPDRNYVQVSFTDTDIEEYREAKKKAEQKAYDIANPPAQGVIHSTFSPIELPIEFGVEGVKAVAGATFGLLALLARKGGDDGLLYMVGAYDDLRKIAAGTGLDAHHVGQAAVMRGFAAGFDYKRAPAILVNQLGHRFRFGGPVLSRATSGLTNARQLLARDIFELRRVYPEIPNEALESLIKLNRLAFPEALKR